MILSQPSVVGPHYHDSSCFCKPLSALCLYQASLGKHGGKVHNKTVLKLEDADSSLQVSNTLNSWLSPILMAVSCLSPVRIQILMSAFIRVSMVSGTLSWSLSSMAVAPSSCRFCTRKQGKRTRKKRSVSGDQNRGRPLKRHVSEKHVSRDCVTHSLVFFLSSAALVYHPEKPQWALGVLDTLLRLWVQECVHVYVCACVHLQKRPLTHTQARPQNIVGVFSQETRWFFGAGCGLVWGHNRAGDLTRPRGRGETGPGSRGKAEEALLSPAAYTSIALSSLIIWNNTALKTVPGEKKNMTISHESSFAFLMWLFYWSCCCSLGLWYKSHLDHNSTLKPGWDHNTSH